MFKKTSQPRSYALNLINNSPLSRARTFTLALHLEKGNALKQPKENHTIKYTPPLTRSKSKQSQKQTPSTEKHTNQPTNPIQTNQNPNQNQKTTYSPTVPPLNQPLLNPPPHKHNLPRTAHQLPIKIKLVHLQKQPQTLTPQKQHHPTAPEALHQTLNPLTIPNPY